MASCTIDNDLYKIGKAKCKKIFAIAIPITFELTQVKLWHHN
jgi:hypothetical protein